MAVVGRAYGVKPVGEIIRLNTADAKNASVQNDAADEALYLSIYN